MARRVPEKVEAPSDDIWGSAPIKWSKTVAGTREYLKKSHLKVKPIMIPQGGHSYNPSASEHKKVLTQVVEQEIKQIESEKETHKALNPHLYKEQ